MAVHDLKGQALPCEAAEFLGSVFALAAKQVQSNIEHDFFGELILLAGKLGATGFFIQEAFDFLQSVLEHQPRTRHEATKALQAVDSLLYCINPQNSDLAEAALVTFAFTIANIQKPGRERLLNAANKLPPEFTKRPLLNGLTIYHNRLIRIEQAIDTSTWTVNDAWSLITIHSHKGGVGKTTVAIALALALADLGRRVCIVDCDDEGPSLHFYLPVDPTKQKEALFFCDWFCDTRDILQTYYRKVLFSRSSMSKSSLSFLDHFLARISRISTNMFYNCAGSVMITR
jgi:hypothetical protein